MNILFICDEYPPGQHGGIGTMVQVLGRELVRQGNQVTVMGLYPFYYGQKDYEVDQGVEVYRMRCGINFSREKKNFFHKAFGRMPDFVRRNINGKSAFTKFTEKIRQVIQEKKIDIIEIQDWNIFTFFIGFQVNWPQFEVPLVVKSNGSYSYFCKEVKKKERNGDLGKKDFLLDVDKALYKRADALSAVSKYTESINQQLFQYDSPAKIMYNSIEVDLDFEIEKQKKEQTFIFTGTLIQKKGIFQLMQTWNKVNEKYPNAELKVFGKGPVEKLQKLLTERSRKQVHFMGHVARELLFENFRTATAAIFPSYAEAFSLAPLEAMSVGCPVINTERGSGKELFKNGKNGSLIDPDNIDGMATKIIELIEKKELQIKYAENGRQTILERFNIGKSAKDHVSFYKEIVKDFSE